MLFRSAASKHELQHACCVLHAKHHAVVVILGDHDKSLNGPETCLAVTQETFDFQSKQICANTHHELGNISQKAGDDTEQLVKLHEDLNKHTWDIQKSPLALTHMHLHGNPAQLSHQLHAPQPCTLLCILHVQSLLTPMHLHCFAHTHHSCIKQSIHVIDLLCTPMSWETCARHCTESAHVHHNCGFR